MGDIAKWRSGENCLTQIRTVNRCVASRQGTRRTQRAQRLNGPKLVAKGKMEVSRGRSAKLTSVSPDPEGLKLGGVRSARSRILHTLPGFRHAESVGDTRMLSCVMVEVDHMLSMLSIRLSRFFFDESRSGLLRSLPLRQPIPRRHRPQFRQPNGKSPRHAQHSNLRFDWRGDSVESDPCLGGWHKPSAPPDSSVETPPPSPSPPPRTAHD
jgi:hypothetical protein